MRSNCGHENHMSVYIEGEDPGKREKRGLAYSAIIKTNIYNSFSTMVYSSKSVNGYISTS
jgi:hypothetical protein